MWLAARLAVLATAPLAACGTETSAPRVEDVTLVAVGVVLDLVGTPVDGAVVHLQALNEGRSGGPLGCTGSLLIGDKVVQTRADGRFAMEFGARSIAGTAVCVIVLGMRPEQSTWRDTASVLMPFIPRTAVTPPDTVRLELRLPP